MKQNMKHDSPLLTPPSLIRNPHIQTVLPNLITAWTQVPLTLRHFDIDSHQQFVLACRAATQPTGNDVLLVIPGIEGSHHSPVVKLLLTHPDLANHTIYALSHRGIQTSNQQTTPYHAGLTEDLRTAVASIRLQHPAKTLHAVGFSMGANILLNYLNQQPHGVDLATAISTPFDLAYTANNTPAFYQKQILKSIRKRMQKDTAIDWSGMQTLRDFDEQVTAPHFGFDSADDYYATVSSGHQLHTITCPTWLVHAADDPFTTPNCWPDPDKLPNNLRLIGSQHGGHMGFLYYQKGVRNWVADIIAAQNQWHARPHRL